MSLVGIMAAQLNERLYISAYTQHLVLYKTDYQNTKYIIFLRALTQIAHSEAEQLTYLVGIAVPKNTQTEECGMDFVKTITLSEPTRPSMNKCSFKVNFMEGSIVQKNTEHDKCDM